MARVARDKSKLKWEPTQKIKPPDGIKSSDYTDAKPFIPSYESRYIGVRLGYNKNSQWPEKRQPSTDNSKLIVASWKKNISFRDMEPRPTMGYLLSMEYARIWRKEREELDKPATQDTKYLPKKFVIRGLNKKKRELKRDKKETAKDKKVQPKSKPK